MKLILCIIAAEAMTQLAAKAEIFDKLREWVKSWCKFTNELLSCPYCISVWVAGFTTILFIYYESAYYFIILLVIHRLSNFIHDFFRVIQNYKIDLVLRRK